MTYGAFRSLRPSRAGPPAPITRSRPCPDEADRTLTGAPRAAQRPAAILEWADACSNANRFSTWPGWPGSTLDEDELERMASELSAVLDHVERIRELDLDGVQPTSHAVDLAGVMRADEPQPCLPREVILAAAPEPVDGGFGVPSPGPAANERTHRADRRRGDRAHPGAARSTPPSCSRPIGRAPPPTSSTPSPGWPTPRRRRRRRRRRWPGFRSPSRTCSAPRACPARRARRSSRATGRRTRRPSSPTWPQPGASLLGKTNQDEFAMGSSNENSALRAGAQPVGSRSRPGRLLGGQRGRRRRRAGAVGDRHRHRRLDPPARGAVRDRRRQAHLRSVLALRHDRVRLLAGPGRPADARRHRRRPAALAHGRPRPPRLHLGRDARTDRAARAPRTCAASALASPRS